MVKMEIDLTDSQMEKVKQLEEQDISVGDAIDLLFQVKDEANIQLDNFDETISLFEKIKEVSMDVDDKQKVLGKEYSETETYDKTIQDAKHKIKWGREFFKF